LGLHYHRRSTAVHSAIRVSLGLLIIADFGGDIAFYPAN
jgi:hypothetical protein